MKSHFTLLFIVFALIASSQTKAPILRIETGIHTSKGYKIATDANGKYLLTASIDKTARFWDAETGNLIKTFRIPLGEKYDGTLYACSLSPDGKVAALGGYTGFEWDNTISIYLINTQTGTIINRIKNLPGTIMDLEFSPDGHWLAAGLDLNAGVYIFDTKGWGEYKRLGGYTNTVNNIAFRNGGGMATVSMDGKIRTYNSNFEKINEKAGIPGKELYSLAYNPAGNLLAVGYYPSPVTVEVRNALDLSVLYKPNVEDAEAGGFYSLSFSEDGSKLYGGSSCSKFISNENKWKKFVRCWNDEGRGSHTDVLVMDNIVADIKPLPGGSIALICFDPADIGVVNASGNLNWYVSAKKNDFTSPDKSHLRVNNTGSSIGFTPQGQHPYSFDILQKNLVQEESLFPAPVQANAGTVVTDWNHNWQPSINGKKLAGFDGKVLQECLSTDISSNGSQVVLSESWNILLYNKNSSLVWAANMETNPFAVNISGNDKVVVAAANDGTIHWFSMADGKELLTFYLLPDGKRWVLFTPTGYYDASPGAEDFLGWHLNNGPDEAPSFFPVSRFKEKFYRPDVIDALFETYDEEEALALANRQNKKVTVTTERDIRQKLPPTIIINSPSSGSSISSNTVSISYEIKNPDDAPVKNLRVLVDGRPVAAERGAQVTAAASKKINVTVPSQDCTVTMLAENENGTSPETNLFLKWVNPVAATEEFVIKPKLYVLAIGVSDYNNPDFKLGLAAKDAGDFAEAVAKQKGILFSDVVIKKLINKEATKDAFTDGLDWIQKQTGQKDVAMIFFAGHGINDQNGIFYMLPVAADMERIRSTCLNFEELKQTVSSIAGKVVVFIDACHSGNVMGSSRRSVTDINAMVNELSSTENGAITFTSSTGKEFSLEDPSWGNGAFTKAVIEGLGGMAAFGSKNKITVKSLDAYISERVKELTKGKQHPTSVSPPNVPDFPIAVKQ